ncbi:MAG: hypothetical protein ACKV0T_03835 [Planctomycetales bacterium]
MRTNALCLGGLVALSGLLLHAEESAPTAVPRPVPLTRPEMKQYLEDLKTRPQRIPLPELTEADRTQLGERAQSYESRLRYHYLPGGEGLPGGFGGAGGPAGAARAGTNNRTGAAGFDFTRNADPRMTLDYPFKTMLFWIVSRTNNCQYCLGHQEQKLSAAGLTEDQIAALDFDWERYTPAQQAAFAYARKLTFEPHRIGESDVDALRKHYTDLQILEMTTSISGNNSINRWKEGAGIPQSKTGESFFRRAVADLPKDRPVPNESFLTPTSPEFLQSITIVAPLQLDAKTGTPTRATVCNRPALESRGEVERALETCRRRQPRLPIVTDGEAREVLADVWPAETFPQWARLLANFPVEGKNRIQGLRSADDKGDLTPKLKAQVSWIVARQDRAWYAAHQARQRLLDLGQTDDEVFLLDGSWNEFSAAEQAQFNVARNLAATPIVLTDDDVSLALKQTSPREVVQLINYVTGRAYFDRVTEAAGLGWDSP